MEHFNFKKKYGQNFLNDNTIVKKIASIAEISKKSLVLEVGPGKGILTKELSLQADNVLCYEIDLELKDILESEFKNSNVDFIFNDFLNRDIKNDIEEYSYDNLYFVSNVPYYITTPILMKLIESDLNFNKIVMMVQEEVGERFSAKVNSRSYGSITVFLNYYFEIKKEFKVNRKSFTPIPNVKTFFKLVKDSFKFKRKNIKNNLNGYDLKSIEAVLKKYELDLTARAEQIPVEAFVDISNVL